MISINPAELQEREIYKLLIGSVVPRPIALVTTLSGNILNAAPFSYFSIVSSSPPLLSIAVQRRDGVRKDTARNAIEQGELVVHITDESIINDVNLTAANLPAFESEVDLTGFSPIASETVEVPGLAQCKIRMECVLEQAIPLGGQEGSAACDLLIARVVRFHIDKHIYDKGSIDVVELKPVSRLAGNYYSTLGKPFAVERPQ